MRIRQALPDDASAVAGVYVRSWQAAFAGLVPQHYLDAMDPTREESNWKTCIAETRWPSSGLLAAETEAGIIGFASFGPSQDSAAQFRGGSDTRTATCDNAVVVAAFPAGLRCSAELRSRVSQEAPAMAEIGTLYAMPEFWGAGVGKQLMLATLATLGQANYAQATLWVLEDNQRARRFYEAAGWRADGAAVEDTTGGASLNKLRYGRSLGSSGGGVEEVCGGVIHAPAAR